MTTPETRMPLRAKTLKGIMGAESQLARREARNMLDSLPPGHPLLQAAGEEMRRSGDIADLPDTHPLKIEIAEAKKRFDERQQTETQEKKGETAESPKVKKARRLKQAREVRERIAREEQEHQERQDAAKSINGVIDKNIIMTEELLTVVRQNVNPFREDPFTRARLSRLERLALAVRRGLIEGKLSTIRVG